MKTFYRQRLPHIQPIGASFFVTFRLFGSLPRSIIKELKVEYEDKIQDIIKKDITSHQKNLEIFNLRKEYLVEYDSLLHKVNTGPIYLANDNIRAILQKQLHRFDNILYDLICYSIMSNHVHILINTSIQLEAINDDTELEMNYKPLDVIMKKIKGPSAWYSNKELNKNGQFWERESFDIYIRNEIMYSNVISYILNNPIKANMVKNWEEFPGNYLKLS